MNCFLVNITLVYGGFVILLDRYLNGFVMGSSESNSIVYNSGQVLLHTTPGNSHSEIDAHTTCHSKTSVDFRPITQIAHDLRIYFNPP